MVKSRAAAVQVNLWVWVAVLLFSSQKVRRTDDAGDVSMKERDDGFERVKPTCGLQTTSEKRRDEHEATKHTS